MTKILGLDLGTNSIGWAVVEKGKPNFQILDKGVRIFQEGVKIEKGNESSKAAERTSYRSARRLKFRRKIRKINLLKVLSDFEYCPKLNDEELKNWQYKKIYPTSVEFINWWRTNEIENKTPYYFRNKAVTEKLDLEKPENRYIIGRAFYHMVQRRGFLSNRLETTKESDGAVQKSIDEISRLKEGKTLGQYFFEKYLKGDKIRDQYTHREQHYLEEFNRICEFQQLSEDFIQKAKNAIFYQRPLKSQKGLVGKCVFEKNKSRCSVSHPLFEEYRMLCFVNNIKIKTPYDDKLRFLNEAERAKAIERFYLKSKPHFDFEDIAKQLAPKNQYKYYKNSKKNPEDYLFNFKMNATVTGNPVCARFREILGSDFLNFKISYVREKDNKSSNIDINDIWHVLFTFDSEEKLKEFALKRLNFNEEQTKEFLEIRLKKDYTSLSLNAIKKILPFLRSGLIYSHAVVMANMIDILPAEVWNDLKQREEISYKILEIINTQNREKAITEIVNSMVKNCRDNGETFSDNAERYFKNDLINKLCSYFGENTYNTFSLEERNYIENTSFDLFKKQMNKRLYRGEFIKVETIDERVKNYLKEKFHIIDKKLDQVYHPSAIETYKQPLRSKDGKRYLNSPMVSSIRNPMAMRALHQLRKLVNELLQNDIIGEDTIINIEMSRGLLNANERKALQTWQREKEKKRKEYAAKIKEHFTEQGISSEPTDDDILKYQLWEEQKNICLYTGQQIALHEFLGAAPKYDIEHTIPRSISVDNSQENKTLCDNKYNRSIKKNKIPTQLENHKEILGRIEFWKEKIEQFEEEIERAIRQSKAAADKDSKDRAIQKRHKLIFERNYWRGKYARFTMDDVPEGFKNSQLVDIGIITKYSKIYLNTLFEKVYTVKGSIVADFRVMWGIQNEFEKKERINHIHHCIDALVIACINKKNYEKLAVYYHEQEQKWINNDHSKPSFEKPWETFTEDVKEIEKEVFVSHYTPDVLHKQSKRKLRKRGKIVMNNGKPVYLLGDTVRGSLHKDTFYGAIERPVLNKDGVEEKQIKYVVRKNLLNIKASEIDKIVDEKVREVVTRAVEEKTLVISASDGQLNKISGKIWLNEQKGVEIKKVRIYQPMVTNPIHLKKQRDTSLCKPKPYKEHYHVMNDGNYLMAIYEGKDKKGKIKRDFEIKSKLEAGEYFKLSVKKFINQQDVFPNEGLLPLVKTANNIEMPLKAIIKIGTMVILWEKSPEEVWDLSKSDCNKRMYKIIGLSNQRITSSSGNINEYATIVLRFAQEARPSTDLKVMDGAFEMGEQFKAQRKMNHNQFNALVEGYDFKITASGKIIRLK